MRAVNLAFLSIGCSSWPGWGFEAPVHWRPFLWCFYARRNIPHVLAVSFAMEIAMHSSILYKGHCACVWPVSCAALLFLTIEAPTMCSEGEKNPQSLISTRIIMAERHVSSAIAFSLRIPRESLVGTWTQKMLCFFGCWSQDTEGMELICVNTLSQNRAGREEGYLSWRTVMAQEEQVMK